MSEQTAAYPIVNDGYAMVPIGDLVQHPDNPNESDLGKIIESLEVNGWYGVVYVQRSTGYIIAGNHRVQAARHLGFTELPVVYLDVDDRRAMKILLVDNESTRSGNNQIDALAQILSMLATDSEGLAGTGFDGDDLDAMIEEMNRPLDLGAKKQRSKSHNVQVRCGSEDEQNEVLQKLLALGLDARAR